MNDHELFLIPNIPVILLSGRLSNNQSINQSIGHDMIYEYLRNILEVFFLLVVKRLTLNAKLTLVMRIN